MMIRQHLSSNITKLSINNRTQKTFKYKNILIQPIVHYQWASNVVKIVNLHFDN